MPDRQAAPRGSMARDRAPRVPKDGSKPRGGGPAVPDLPPSYGALLASVWRASDAGLVVPCLGPESEAWTSEDTEVLDIAAVLCLDCPSLAECRQPARDLRPSASVWGARVRGSNPRNANDTDSPLTQGDSAA